MGTLCYTLLQSEAELKAFDCGNPSINRLVAESFYPTVLKQIRTYQISLRGKCVGFCAFSVASLSVEYSDAPIAEYYSNCQSYGALQINFIAVDKRLHRKGIGSNALEYIVKKASEAYKEIPIRILVLDALRNKFEWYACRGFSPVKSSDVMGTSETIMMYYDLMPEEDRSVVSDYILTIV